MGEYDMRANTKGSEGPCRRPVSPLPHRWTFGMKSGLIIQRQISLSPHLIKWIDYYSVIHTV